MPDTTQTNIATEITRIQNDRNTIRTKLVELGMAESTSNLDTLATAISGITNQGAVSATVKEGDTYTIPKGYHNGSGTVSGVSGGGNYNLQSKKVTPTKSQQSVTPDSGYYGLSDVTVAAIPSNYQDVSSVTATAADVLSGKIVVDSTGKDPDWHDGQQRRCDQDAGHHDHQLHHRQGLPQRQRQGEHYQREQERDAHQERPDRDTDQRQGAFQRERGGHSRAVCGHDGEHDRRGERSQHPERQKSLGERQPGDGHHGQQRGHQPDH